MQHSAHTTAFSPLPVAEDAPAIAPPAAPPAYARPDPAGEERIRGPRLVLLWGALITGSWALFGGIGYGLYCVVTGAF